MSIRKTPEYINNLLIELKNKHYPILKNNKIILKQSIFLKKIFMITLPFSKKIYYNDRLIQKCSNKALIGVIMHELYHLYQFKKLKKWQKIVFIPKYHVKESLRIKHELEAHIEVTKMGFGEELIELNHFVKIRYPKKVWDRKWSKYYLSDEKIKKLMKEQDENDTKIQT